MPGISRRRTRNTTKYVPWGRFHGKKDDAPQGLRRYAGSAADDRCPKFPERGGTVRSRWNGQGAGLRSAAETRAAVPVFFEESCLTDLPLAFVPARCAPPIFGRYVATAFPCRAYRFAAYSEDCAGMPPMFSASPSVQECEQKGMGRSSKESPKQDRSNDSGIR